MTSHSEIPEAAVEAAHKAWREQAKQDGSIFEYNLRAAIEAAADHLNLTCDPDENVPIEALEFEPVCQGCGEVLVHDYYCGELVYRHARPAK